MTEKWRFACPDCGCRHLSKRTREGGYRCNECGHVMSAAERVDLKAQGEANV